jgi:sugar lactone lactonase YvrE
MKAPKRQGRSIASAMLSAWLLLLSSQMFAQKVTTTVGGFIGDNGPGTSAGFDYPRAVLQDSAGNTFVADAFNHRIRKIAPDGTISTFAGTGIAGFSGDGGLAKNAMLNTPNDLRFDAAGDMLVSDGGNNRIRKIDPTGVISTIAGNGLAGFSGDGGPALQAELNLPWGLALDAAGNIFLSDVLNLRVRKIDTAGNISTIAGNGIAGYNGDNIPAILAELNFVRQVAVDSQGNVYLADLMNHRVRKVDTSGTITTFAGTGMNGFSGDGGPATQANIGNPRGLLISGNFLYISNAGAAHIRRVNFQPPNIINTFAGLMLGYDGDGNPPLLTDFNGPTGMMFMANGSLLVADQQNARLRLVTAAVTSTLAGGFVGDNRRGRLAVLTAPENFGFDSAGNYYIAEYGGQRIRMLDAGSGQITTIAGNGTSGYSGDGGSATQAQLWAPQGVAADNLGNIYIADTFNAVIRKVDAAKNISTFATDPNFSDLVSLATDSAGNVYSADDGACVIRKIDGVTGAISIVVGMEFICGFNGDGIPATSAQLNSAYGVAVDSRGNIYIGDTLNNRIRKVNPRGIISTIAGNGTCGFSGDGGPGASAMICNPEGVAVDTKGNVYFGDYLNLRVRKITRAGTISTVAGSGNGGYNGDGLPAVSTNLDGPIAVGVDNLGTLFELDDIQARVRRIR